MPLRMSPELLFPTGATIPLPESALLAFLSYVRRIQSQAGRKYVLEEFKRCFCRAAGEPYSSSSSEGWADSDLETRAREAAANAPSFIHAFVEGCELLQHTGAVTPDSKLINCLLEQHDVPFRIADGALVLASNFVAPPQHPESAASIASRAFSEAARLVTKGQAPSAIDRIHTALNGYLIELCNVAHIATDADSTTSKLFRALRESHPAFRPVGPRFDDVDRILKTFASAVDALSPIRNKASLAHANPLLEEPEATAVINSAYTVFRYIQDCLARYAAVAT